MNSIQYQQFKILILNILPLNENSKQTIVVQREIDLLHNIFERLKKIKCDVKITNAEDILSFTNFQSNLIFIVTHFDGKVFDFLVLKGCRIFSTSFINYILNNSLSLPKSSYPIFSNFFTGVTVSFTGLSLNVKIEKTKYIQYMGGNVSKELNYLVTHLVADTCDSSSEKYKACQFLKLPVMSINWIDDAWRAANEAHYFDAKALETIKKYSLPILKGCVITISGFTSNERSNIGRLIELHGGIFCGEMSKNTCTHLITSSNSGAKFRKAVQWGTFYIVDEKWLRKSIELEYRLSEKKFNRIDQNTTQKVQLLINNPKKENEPLLEEQENITQNSINVADNVDSMEVDSMDFCIEKNSKKKVASVFDLIEKSTKDEKKTNLDENSIGFNEKRRQNLILNDKKCSSTKIANNLQPCVFKLPGDDLDMAERDRNVMAWVEGCQNQFDETSSKRKTPILTETNNRRKLFAKSKASSILLGQMVVNIHYDLLLSNIPVRANELKKEILEVLNKYELMLFDETTSGLAPN